MVKGGDGKAAAVILMLILILSPPVHGAAAARMLGEGGGDHGGHHAEVEEPVATPAFHGETAATRSNCTHDANSQWRSGPCPPW
ncbi:hypothetical protein ACP4OV_023965 [Aristida adscensionis]